MAAPDLTDFDTEEKRRLAIPTSAFDGRSLIASAPAVDLNALPPGPEMLTRLMQSDPHAAAGLPSPGAPEPAALMPPPAAPAAPSKPILDTKSTSQTSEKLSKVQQEDFAQLDAIKTAETTAQDKLTKDNQEDAKLQVIAEKAKAQAAENAANAKAQAVADSQARRAQAEATYQQKLEAFNGKEFHSYWSGRPAAAEILADIGVALGAFGASGRGQNEALQILNGRIEQDFNLQRAQIEKAKDSVIMAKTGVADADQARAIALDDLEIKRNAATQAIEARLLAGKTAQLGDRAAAEGELKKAGFAKDIQDRKERTTAGMATRTTSTQNFVNPDAIELKSEARRTAAGAHGKPTDSDKHMAVYGSAIGDAVREIGDASMLTPGILAQYQKNQLGAEAADNSASKGVFANAMVASGREHGLIARSKFDGIPEAAQKALQQIEVAKESLARIHSGGAIPTPEDRAFADMWAPKTGDQPGLISQKLRQMDTEGKRLVALSGNAAGLISGITNAEPAKSNTPAPASASRLDLAREALNDPGASKQDRDRAREILLTARAAGR